MPKVSVIVPIYNVENYLVQCFESIRNQTMGDFEVLAVNDGSPDNSQEIIDRYVQMDSRFKSLIKENGGLSDARNYAIPYVNSKYIFFLDSDDSLVLDALEKLVNHAEKTDSDLVICGYYEVSCNGKPVNPVVYTKEIHSGSLQECPDILNALPHCAWNKLYSSHFFTELGITYPKGLYYEDCGTSPLVYLHAKKISYLAEPLIQYLIDRPGNITQSVNYKIIEVVENLKRVNDYYHQQGMFHKLENELCLFNLRLIYDNLWKLKMVDDEAFVSRFFQEAFQHLNQSFSNWKTNEFFDRKNLKGKLIAWMMKNPKIYQWYLTK